MSEGPIITAAERLAKMTSDLEFGGGRLLGECARGAFRVGFDDTEHRWVLSLGIRHVAEAYIDGDEAQLADALDDLEEAGHRLAIGLADLLTRTVDSINERRI